MDISNIITATVSLTAPGITRIGFGEPCVFFYGTNAVPTNDPIDDTELVRRYNSSTALADMVTDGFATTDPVYLAVQAIVSQSPSPPTVKVARGGTAYTHDVELTPDTYTSGATIALTITSEGTSRTYSQTAGGSSLTAEATALAALLNADTSGWGSSGSADLTIASSGSTVTIDADTDGQMWYYSARTNVSLEDVTADRGVATDLAAIVALDADWYGLVPADAFGEAELTALATWVAAQTNKMGFFGTQDDEVLAGTGIGDTLKGANRQEVYLVHSKHSMSQYPGGAVAGRFLPLDPGTAVWAHKNLSGVTPSSYTSAQVTAMTADYVNFYSGVEIGGIEVVTGNLWKGWSSGSSETFADTIRLIDALTVEIQTRVLSALRTSNKVPYTDQGISTIKAAILAGIRAFQPDGFQNGSEFCNIPLASSATAVDRAARELQDVEFGATLAGGIVKVTITGQLSV